MKKLLSFVWSALKGAGVEVGTQAASEALESGLEDALRKLRAHDKDAYEAVIAGLKFGASKLKPFVSSTPTHIDDALLDSLLEAIEDVEKENVQTNDAEGDGTDPDEHHGNEPGGNG